MSWRERITEIVGRAKIHSGENGIDAVEPYAHWGAMTYLVLLAQRFFKVAAHQSSFRSTLEIGSHTTLTLRLRSHLVVLLGGLFLSLSLSSAEAQGYGLEVSYGIEGLSPQVIQFVADNGARRTIKADQTFETYSSLANRYCEDYANGYEQLIEAVLQAQSVELAEIQAGMPLQMPTCLPAAPIVPVVVAYPTNGFDDLIQRYWPNLTDVQGGDAEIPPFNRAFKHDLTIDTSLYTSLFAAATAIDDDQASAWRAAQAYRRYGLVDDDVVAIELGALGLRSPEVLVAETVRTHSSCPICETDLGQFDFAYPKPSSSGYTFVQGTNSQWVPMEQGRGLVLDNGFIVESNGGNNANGVIRFYRAPNILASETEPTLQAGLEQNLSGQNFLTFTRRALSEFPIEPPSSEIVTLQSAISELNNGRSSEDDFSAGEFFNFVAPSQRKVEIELSEDYQRTLALTLDAVEPGFELYSTSSNPNRLLDLPSETKLQELVFHFSAMSQAETWCGPDAVDLLAMDTFMAQLGTSLELRDRIGITRRGTGIAIWDIGFPEQFFDLVDDLPFDLVSPDKAEAGAFVDEEKDPFVESHGVSVAAVSRGLGALNQLSVDHEIPQLETLLKSIFRVKDQQRIFRIDREIEALTRADVEIVNLSIGKEGPHFALRNAIERNPSKLFVVAAGNLGYGEDEVGKSIATVDLYPQMERRNSRNMIVVAAVDQSGNALAEYSNFGDRFVEIAAQGCFPKTPVLHESIPEKIGLRPRVGTSFAAPQVSFVAAVLRELITSIEHRGNPLLLKSRILATAIVNEELANEGQVAHGLVLDPVAAVSPFQTILRFVDRTGADVELRTSSQEVNRDPHAICDRFEPNIRDDWTLLRIKKTDSGKLEAIFRTVEDEMMWHTCVPFSHGKFFFGRPEDLGAEFSELRNIVVSELSDLIFFDPLFGME